MLEDRITKLIPLINEANLSAEKFNKDVHFETELVTTIPESHIALTSEQKTETFIKVSNHELGQSYLWDQEKFIDRLYVIRELVNQYFDTNIVPRGLWGKEDPFADDPEPQLIGQGYYKLEGLAYLIDNPFEMTLAGHSGKDIIGRLEVNVIPTDESGWNDPPEEDIPDEPEELEGKRVDF